MDRPSLFPKEATTAITIFPRYTSLLTGNAKNITIHLHNCIHQADAAQITERTGLVIRSAVKILIPYLSMYTGRKYIPPAKWNMLSESELSRYWTLDPTQTTALPIIIRSESTHEFTWATPAQLNLQETAFLNANPDARRMTTLDANVPSDEDVIRREDPKTYERMRNLWLIEVRGAR